MRSATSTCAAVVAGAGVLLAGASVAIPSDRPLAYARVAILGGALGALALHDVREHRIPNRIVLPAATICAALSIAEGVQPSVGLYAGAVLVVVLLAVSLTVPAALGMGDVKLALLILCALDGHTALALLTALELYALVAVVLLIRRGRAALGESLPLAPIVAASCLIAVLL
ncbi:MAG: prepilin peptidase [Solirubrobacteraceae bacterium]